MTTACLQDKSGHWQDKRIIQLIQSKNSFRKTRFWEIFVFHRSCGGKKRQWAGSLGERSAHRVVLQHALRTAMRATRIRGRWTSFHGNTRLKMEKAACQLRQTAGGAVPFAEAGIKSWLAGWLAGCKWGASSIYPTPSPKPPTLKTPAPSTYYLI